jgi:hypothetical protein
MGGNNAAGIIGSDFFSNPNSSWGFKALNTAFTGMAGYQAFSSLASLF